MTEHQFPSAFITRIAELYGPDKALDIIPQMRYSGIYGVRINTLRGEVEEIRRSLVKQGINLFPVTWSKTAFVTDSPRISVGMTRELQNGKLYFQSLSSMVPVIVMDPQPEEEILDMAAAPGSKTSQIAALMKNKGEIFANDIDRNRIYKLEFVLRMMGVENVVISRKAGQSLWQQYPEGFDRVLLDAPCSLEGQFDLDRPASYRGWSVKKVKELARLQQWLLRSAVSATVTGGIIIYSTCTISPEENEGVVSWILEKEKGLIELEEIKMQGVPFVDGITKWGKDEYGSEMKKTKRILPAPGWEAFYVAKFRKVASNVSSLQ